jgi:predicted metal-dependent phosphotriesterase family hydrolase
VSCLFAWRELLTGMREHGVSQAEIDRMTKTNPARLLGLD